MMFFAAIDTYDGLVVVASIATEQLMMMTAIAIATIG